MSTNQAEVILTGRELDYAAGRLVLGYQIYHYDKSYPESNYFMLMDSQFGPVAGLHEYRANAQRRTEAEAWEDCPKFSESLDATPLLVDALDEEHGTRLQLTQQSFGKWGAVFVAGMQCYSGGGVHPAEAITRAALKATEALKS